jgi:hypothetical protein
VRSRPRSANDLFILGMIVLKSLGMVPFYAAFLREKAGMCVIGLFQKIFGGIVSGNLIEWFSV